MFTEEDEGFINSIHFSRSSSLDRLIWHDSVTGEFSVKSTYYVARKMLGKKVISQQQMRSIWKIIWTANAVPKVKLFSWRMVQNILPSCSNLQKKGMQVEDKCFVCSHVGETTRHFFYCRFSYVICHHTNPNIM